MKPRLLSCVKCGGAAEARVEESGIGMAVSRHPTPAPRDLAYASAWLDSSSAWLGDEDAIILPITSEPYDGSLDEEIEDQFPQYVSIPPPIWDDPPISAEESHTIVPIEQAILIPIEEILPREPATTMEAIDEAPPPEPAEASHFTYIIRTEPERKRGHLVSSALLLLLASILLFVFAWMMHK